MNINQILCNRCGSIILQKMAAHYQHGEPSKHLPLPFQKTKHNNELPKNLETEEFNKWWIVGNMFTFENGFENKIFLNNSFGRKFRVGRAVLLNLQKNFGEI